MYTKAEIGCYIRHRNIGDGVVFSVNDDYIVIRTNYGDFKIKHDDSDYVVISKDNGLWVSSTFKVVNGDILFSLFGTIYEYSLDEAKELLANLTDVIAEKELVDGTTKK